VDVLNLFIGIAFLFFGIYNMLHESNHNFQKSNSVQNFIYYIFSILLGFYMIIFEILKVVD